MAEAVLQSKRVRVPTVIQQEAVECGAACLTMILEYYGRVVPLEEVRVACGVNRDGVKASNIIKAARGYGLEARGFKSEPEELAQHGAPLIIHWNFAHFVVLEGMRGKKIYLNDPAIGRRVVTPEEFDQCFTGVLLTFEPGPLFVRGGAKRTLLDALRRRFRGGRALAYVLLAGLFLVLPGLVTPIFAKVFIDAVLIREMDSWFTPLVVGLAATGIVRALLTALQSHYMLRYRTRMAIDESAGYLSHLLTLPQTFFAQRLVGDLARRVANNDKVADLLTGKLVLALVSMLIVVFYAALMAYFDLMLTLVGIGFALINLVVLRAVNAFRQEQSLRHATEANKLYGLGCTGLRLIETLKATGAENDFFAKWAGYHARAVRTKQTLGKLSYLINALPPLLNRLSTVAILVLGGLQVMSGRMSMGMLVAFQSLMLSFMTPFRNLVQLGASVQEAKGMMTQLDDVFLHAPDPALQHRPDAVALPKLSGRIEIRDLRFGYSTLGPPLVEDFALTLEPGRRVALVGPSGSGKSTVARLLSGLYKPWSGDILFDGAPREAYTRHTLTSSISVVDQNIVMFQGTVRDNLTLWDETVTTEGMIRAAKDAAIHETVISRPGGYGAQVSEGGRNFSGGQRQRMEIARGLASDPSILILDEATSALDPATEQYIDDCIRRRGCTCVIVAHRLSTIRDCDEIIVMERGKIVERGTHTVLLGLDGIYARLIKS